MKPLAIINIEYIEATPFFVCHLFGEEGFMVDQVILPHVTPEQSIEKLIDSASLHDFVPCEVWTSSPALYKEALQTAGLAAHMKHRTDTDGTRREVEQYRDELIELFEVEPAEPLPPLSWWRRWSSLCLRKLLKLIEGERYQ